MLDKSLFSPFLVKVVFLRAKAYFLPRIFDDVLIHKVVKGGVFYLIGHTCTKNWMVLHELNQYWF